MPTELLFVLTVLVIGRTQAIFIRTDARVQQIQIPGAFSSDQCEQNLKKHSYIHTVSWNGNMLVGKPPPGTQSMNVILPRMLMQ